MSPALAFIQHLWDHAQKGTGHSWVRLNRALYDGVSLAIRAGLVFEEADISTMHTTMRGGWWFMVPPCEGWYSLAIEYNNRSAWKAIEAHLKRRPFLVKGHRVHVASSFWYEGHHCTCTSFAPDQSYLIACSTRGAGKIRRRFKIAHAQLKEARP